MKRFGLHREKRIAEESETPTEAEAMAESARQSVLRNQYWILRHGRSIPNESNIVVSQMSNGVLQKYALAPAGKEQAKSAGKLFLKDFQRRGISADNLRIYSSPFSRTRETAEEVIGVLKEEGIEAKLDFWNGFRERNFGPLMELQTAKKHYAECWDPMVGPEGGESAADVAKRFAHAIASIEDQVQGCGIIIVSHGDPLQIFQTIMKEALNSMASKNDSFTKCLDSAITSAILQQHRYFHIKTGELRHIA